MSLNLTNIAVATKAKTLTQKILVKTGVLLLKIRQKRISDFLSKKDFPKIPLNETNLKI